MPCAHFPAFAVEDGLRFAARNFQELASQGCVSLHAMKLRDLYMHASVRSGQLPPLYSYIARCARLSFVHALCAFLSLQGGL